MKRSCWFRALPGAGPCSGRLVRCHLIPQQTLRRELGRGWRKAADDPRSFVWGCGGATGVGGHHGALDWAGVGRLTIPRDRLPAPLEAFAEDHGLAWFLERTYGLMPSARTGSS